MILDSTFINDLIRGNPDAEEKLQELIDDKCDITISSLTVFEVGVGLRGEGEQYREVFSDVVRSVDITPLGKPAAGNALVIQRDLYDRGEPIGAIDVLIAGSIIASKDPTVLTRNVGEFERVSGIEVETY